LARLAAAGAYFVTRLTQQTTLFTAGAGGMQPLALAQGRKTVEGHRHAHDIFLGTKELVPSRLLAVRRPEALVNDRRRSAKNKAQKKGDPPATSPLFLLAGHRFLSPVPATLWPPETLITGEPSRWHIARLFTAWKSDGHCATIQAKKAATVLCYLSGRLLLMVSNEALSPPVRGAGWVKKHRELRVLKLGRHVQALADTWRPVIFQGELARRRFLPRACASAERLAAKAVRKRRTTAQTLRESLRQQPGSVEVVAVANA
jgi:hypothetical protein